MDLRERQEAMGELGAEGGPRSWRVCGTFVDLLGELENLALTPLRTLETPLGQLRLAPVEELLVERVLVAVYPRDYPPARDCAKKLIAAALMGEVDLDWNEVRRLARLPAYANWQDVAQFIDEQAQALEVRNPCDPAG